MKLDQTASLMEILISEYPHLFAGKGDGAMGTKLKLWASLFENDDPDLVFAAVKALLVSSDDVPTAAAIKAQMYALTHPQDNSEIEAWGAVYKAITRSAYNSRQEFDKLSPSLQRLVGSPRQLYDWSQMKPDVISSVVASNFQRSYRAITAAQKQDALLPPEVKAVAARVAKTFALEGGQ